MFGIRPPQLIGRVKAQFDVVKKQGGKSQRIIQRQEFDLREMLVQAGKVKNVVQQGKPESNEQQPIKSIGLPAAGTLEEEEAADRQALSRHYRQQKDQKVKKYTPLADVQKVHRYVFE